MAQYDDVAVLYASRVADHFTPVARRVAERVPALRTAEVVVEVAMGTGALTRALTPRLPQPCRYVGIDLSAGMLHAAETGPHVQRVVADAEALPLASGAADLVVSSLGPLPDSDAALAESFRVLRPNGRLVLGLWGDDHGEREVMRTARHRLGAGDFPTGVEHAVAHRAERAGFREICTDRLRLDVVHDSVASFLDFRSSFGCPSWLDRDRLPELWREIGEAVAPYVTPTGQVALDWEIIVLTARRPAGEHDVPAISRR